MAQYGCSRCGSTASVMEMRRVVATIGPDKELQASGIVPVQRCLNDQCGSLSTLTNLEIGEAVNLVPTAPQDDELTEMKADVVEMKAMLTDAGITADTTILDDAVEKYAASKD